MGAIISERRDMKRERKLLFPVFGLLLAVGSFLSCRQSVNRSLSPETKKEQWMTVFIHGTVGHMLRRPSISMIFDIYKDEVKNTLYERATRHIRKDPFFTTDQAKQGLGLQRIDMQNTKPGSGATALAQVFDKLDQLIYKKTESHDHYYTYGWSGLVSRKKRHKEAQSFYEDLLKEIEVLKTIGVHPKIRLVGYSHGGSIAANLALAQPKKDPQRALSVDELVLIGTPIHDQLTDMIVHPMFKKVYNIYSRADRVQRMDISLPGSTFPRRIFINNKHAKIPEKLTQLRIKMIRNRTTKKRWEKKDDPRRNFNKMPIFQGHSNLLRNSSPGHTELWFFDWVRAWYRENFPLKPLPAVALLPRILQVVKEHGENIKHLVVDLRPQQEAILLKQKGFRKVLPLVSEKNLEELKKVAQKFSIKKITEKENQKHMRKAIKKATQERSEEKRKEKLLVGSKQIPQP